MAINEEYTNESAIYDIQKSLSGEFSGVTLQDFLHPEDYEDLKKAVVRTRFTKKNIPNKFCFGSANLPKKVLKFLHSKEFLEFVSKVLDREVTQLDEGSCYSFGSKDYTLLHDEMILDEGVDIILDFTAEWVDGVGGEIVYTRPGKEVATIGVFENSLTIVKRDSEMHRFISYVNHYAGDKKRYFVLVTVH